MRDDRKNVQRAAQHFMQKIGSRYPANLQQIVQLLNARIYHCSDMPDNVNGATLPLQDGSYIITIRSHQPFLGERLSVAREIAHIVLGHCAEGIVVTSSFERFHQGIFPFDSASYFFALELLVPLEELKSTLAACEILDIDKLCTLYGVPGEIIKARLNEIEMIQFSPTLPYTLSLALP